MRYTHIEDVLVALHPGQWFGWSDSKNKVYKNLVIHDGQYQKPAKAFLNSELARLQAEYDEANAPWVLARQKAYPTREEAEDMKWHDQKNGTNTWFEAIDKVKRDNPKG